MHFKTLFVPSCPINLQAHLTPVTSLNNDRQPAYQMKTHTLHKTKLTAPTANLFLPDIFFSSCFGISPDFDVHEGHHLERLWLPNKLASYTMYPIWDCCKPHNPPCTCVFCSGEGTEESDLLEKRQEHNGTNWNQTVTTMTHHGRRGGAHEIQLSHAPDPVLVLVNLVLVLVHTAQIYSLWLTV